MPAHQIFKHMKAEFPETIGKSRTFYCFSPTVMLATFTIEFSLAIYTFIRFRMTRFGQLAAAALVLLGIFQVAEYQICGGDNQIFWARLGYVAITLLPPLGIHLIAQITGNSRYLKFAYAIAAIYITLFMLASKSIIGAACEGNYVIFRTAQNLYWTYGIYYTGFLLLGVWEIIEKINEDRNKDFSLLVWMAAGYFSFMVPMAIVYLLFPETRQAVPSVMCGFAVILAVLLAFVIVPKYHERKIK